MGADDRYAHQDEGGAQRDSVRLANVQHLSLFQSGSQKSHLAAVDVEARAGGEERA